MVCLEVFRVQIKIVGSLKLCGLKGKRYTFWGWDLFGLAVAVHESLGGHGLFTFGLELVDGDITFVLAFNHEWGSDATEDGWVADDGGHVDEVGF